MRRRLLVSCIALGLVACRSSCHSPPPNQERVEQGTLPPIPLAAPLDAAAAPEMLPRCRGDGPSIVVPGEDVVVGDALVTETQIAIGVVRKDGGKRVASVVVAPLDLASVKTIDVGASLGDDPPPALRLRLGGAQPQDKALYAAFFARKTGADAGAAQKIPVGTPNVTRELAIAKLENNALGPAIGTVQQHADESLAFDYAWTHGATAPIVAWDEDAPVPEGKLGADRGLVKVQILGEAARVASPEGTDAEAPRLVARPGGYWLAWIAKRPERPGRAPSGESAATKDDAGYELEGPGEHRAFRWVEAVALDAKGKEASPVRRVTPERGHVVTFELTAAAGAAFVLAQDEGASSEGAGGRIVRHPLDEGAAGAKEKAEVIHLADAGVGHALAELTLPSLGGPRWVAWTDTAERVHVAPITADLKTSGPGSLEPAFEGARLLATGAGNTVYAAVMTQGVSIRRFSCAP